MMNSVENKLPCGQEGGHASAEAEMKQRLIEAFMKKRLLLNLVVAIINPEDKKKLQDVLKNNDAHIICQFAARGTANSELLDLLGLGTTHKVVSVSLANKAQAALQIREITKTFRMRVRGNGIVFSIPISGATMPVLRMSGPALEELEQTVEKKVESEVETMKQEAMYELILSIINPGYSEDLMDAARSAGATGGTVFHARQIGTEVAKVFGITLQEEREIVAILTPKEQKKDIMRAINAAFGLRSEAKGLTICLPINDVAGLEE